MTFSDLLLFCARKSPIGLLRKSAYRKYCRRNVGRQLQVECQGGFSMNTMLGDSVDNQIAVYGIFEIGTTRAIAALAKESASFLDVGCNIGYYSCLFGAQGSGKRLVAVDPNPSMAARTKENLELNGVEDFEVLTCGVGAEDGQLELHIPRDRHSLSSFAYVPTTGGPSVAIEAQIRPLPGILAEQGLTDALVKIDTEGFECEVLRGVTAEAAAKIKFMLFELASANLVQAGSSVAEIFALPVMKNYEVFLVQDGAGGYIEKAELSALLAATKVNANVLMVRNDAATLAALQRTQLTRGA